MKNYIKEILGMLTLVIIIFLLLKLVVGSYAVISQSMEPGLQMGQRLLVNKIAYNFDQPDRGDIVYYKTPEGEHDQLKRVIGISGDIVEIKNRCVYINGIRITEPYVKNAPAYTLESYQVPINHFFILGDNRSNSNDSSSGWTVPRENILGKAWLYTWPPDKWGSINNYSLDQQLSTAELP